MPHVQSWVDNANKRRTFPPTYRCPSQHPVALPFPAPAPTSAPLVPHWGGEAIVLDMRQSSDDSSCSFPSTSSHSTLPPEDPPPQLCLPPPSMLASQTLDGMGARGCRRHATIGDIAGHSPVAHPRTPTQVTTIASKNRPAFPPNNQPHLSPSCGEFWFR